MIEIFVDDAPYQAALRFWIIDRQGVDGKTWLLRFGKHHTTLEEIKEGYTMPDPTFSLSQDKAQQFFKQMAELALKRGIKTESDKKLEGRLGAVEDHLSDMRKLVFKEAALLDKPKGE